MAGNTPILTDYEEKNAPWNKVEEETQDYEVFMEQTMVCRKTVQSTDSTEACREFECRTYSITDFLKELEKYLTHDLSLSNGNSAKEQHIRNMMAELQRWEVKETYIDTEL